MSNLILSPPASLASIGIPTGARDLAYLMAHQNAIETAGALPESLGSLLSLSLFAHRGVLTSGGVAPTDGQAIASWSDTRVGGLQAVVASGTPFWAKNAYGPLPCIRFKAGDTLSITDTDALRPDSSPFHVFAVVRNACGQSSFILEKGNSASSVAGYALFVAASASSSQTVAQYARVDANSVKSAVEYDNFTGAVHMLELALDGTSALTGYLDGSSAGYVAGGGGASGSTYSPPISNTDNLIIGGAGAFDLYALLIFKGAMTADQVNMVRNYLKALYALGSAPTAVTMSSAFTALWTNGVQHPVSRIPALVRCNDNSLLAFTEARSSFSDTGYVYIVCKRSTDGGKTWGAEATVANDGVNCFHNPAPIVDRSTGRIHVLCSWNLGTASEAQIIAGTPGADTSHAYYVYSDNFGATWSTPVDVSASVKRSGDAWWACGPGGTEQLASGRLLFPCCDSNVAWTGGAAPLRSYMVYSDDHGATFHVGGSSFIDGTDECRVAQRSSDGLVLCHMRNENDQHRWAMTGPSNGGIGSFTAAAAQTELFALNINSALCYGGGNIVICSYLPVNLAGTRQNLTISVSADFGVTWPSSTLAFSGACGYSDIVSIGAGVFGLMFENNIAGTIEFTTFTIAYPAWSI